MVKNLETNDTLFPMEAFKGEGKERKRPESEAEKRLREIRVMEERDFANLRNKLNRGQALTASEAKRLEEYRRRYEEQAGGNLPEHVVTSKEAVAAHFGKTKRTVINWGHRGMPELPNGYDLAAIGEWAFGEGLIRDRGLIPGHNGKGVDDPEHSESSPVRDREPDLAHWEKENKRLASELKAFNLALKRGEYVLREEVAEEWAGRMREVAKGLDYLANLLPPLLEGKSQGEMRSVIGNETWKIRDRYAREGRFCPSREEM